MTEQLKPTQADIHYLIECVRAHADKFPVPSHMRELCDRIAAERSTNADDALVRLLHALAFDCENTDGWEDAAPTCRAAAQALSVIPQPTANADDGLVERVAGAVHAALSRANIMAYLDMPLETANDVARAALSVIPQPASKPTPGNIWGGGGYEVHEVEDEDERPQPSLRWHVMVNGVGSWPIAWFYEKADAEWYANAFNRQPASTNPFARTNGIEWHKPAHRAVIASVKLGAWMSAALDDPAVCDAMKADIREWFSAGEPIELLGQALSHQPASIEPLVDALKDFDPATASDHQWNVLYCAALDVVAQHKDASRPETFASIITWGDETFGPSTTERIIERAWEEWQEMTMPGANIPIEAADVIIVLLRIPGIAEAIQTKMAVNRARKWNLMGDGTGYHISEDTSQ